RKASSRSRRESRVSPSPAWAATRSPTSNFVPSGSGSGIIPKARKTVGSATPPQHSAPERAAGRVDITDELRRYVLYRFREGENEVWLIDDLNSEPKTLDKEAFEKALMSYLR